MIQKPITTANGPARFHVFKKVEANMPFVFLMLTIDSYADEATYLAGGNLIFRVMVSMPAASIPEISGGAVEAWLIADPSSPFQGGQITADQSDTLDAAKERAWVAMKAARAAAEAGTFSYDGALYDIDQAHITGSVVLAGVANSAGAPYSEQWTLADNTVRDLDADQVIALGVALGQQVSSIYKTARTLRAQIDAATSSDDLSQIHWPI